MHIPEFPQRSHPNLLLALRQDSGWRWKRRRIAISILQMSIKQQRNPKSGQPTAPRARLVNSGFRSRVADMMEPALRPETVTFWVNPVR